MVTNRSRVWRAASHTVRRRLIELLRDGPRTTGDLASAFSVSRFAVMKHLRVLKAAGLVVVRRVGRSSWNELIPGPLSELDRRWPAMPHGPIAPLPASGGAGDRTRDGAASHEPVRSPVVPAQHSAEEPSLPRLCEIRLELFLDAERSRVFDALTFDMSAWWGAPHLRSPHARSVAIEGFLGGRFFEEWGHRQGVLRGLVTVIEQGRHIEVAGAITQAGPFQSIVVFSLAGREGGTLLEFQHRGVLESEERVAAYEAAWRDLLGLRLRSYVERGARSGIGHAPEEQAGVSGLF